MSFYNKGKAHKIAAMASKSCNAVSARDLFVPLTATVNVDTTHRTFAIEVVATCYFGTRINIENIFHDMTLNQSSVPNITINAWVSSDEPGKQIATVTINGTYNAEGIPSIRRLTIPFSGKMTYYKDVGCTKQAEIPFNNDVTVEIENIEPHYTQPAKPTITNVTALEDALLVDVQTTSFGEGGGKYLYVEASKSSDFSNKRVSDAISTLTGTCRISNLQVNTNYYIRAVCANNGRSRNGDVQQNATLAASEITEATYYTTDMRTLHVEAIVYNGSGANPVSTQLQMSENGENWTEIATSSSTTTLYSNIMLNYDRTLFRTQTTTSAGVYTSDTFVFERSSGVGVELTGITQNGGTSVIANFRVLRTEPGAVTAKVYYRPYGMEEEWILAETKTIPATSSNFSTTINGLIPNYAEYEISVNAKQGSLESDSNPVQFFTIPVVVSNDTCDSLDYMVQLICQTYNAIKQGNIVVYMNDDTKKWCEGEDGIPTLATIMSRINRYMHAVGCVLCSMDGFIELLKQSEPNQVFMGKLGWTDCDDEPIQNSVKPVLSDGIFDAIDELIHQVWHYVGNYDYYAYNPLELNAQSGTATGQTAVMGNKKYKWDGSGWVEDGEPIMENFGVIHIDAGRYADKAFYWFVDGWNRLDADTDEIEARLDALESLTSVESYDLGNYKIALVAETGVYNDTKTLIDTTVPTDVERDTIVLITQPERQDETHLVVYDDGDGNPIP